ncbi:MAG: AURKAIP1/COX24 domain-containing protein [Deltaproteobacteria bacterium]|nr:AURKAIP1/COX24 domain-containing protein [Deltaproteobacteria bacterium]
MSSVVKKRRKKIRKHKYRKLLKSQRHKTKR